MELAKLADTPEEEYLDQVNYRDMSFSVYLDRRNSIYYTIVAGKRIVICPAGESYREKIQSAIDENMFCAEDFGDSAKLIWFQNGEHLDLKLVDHGRILYVYITSGDAEPDIDAIARHARSIINKYRSVSLK